MSAGFGGYGYLDDTHRGVGSFSGGFCEEPVQYLDQLLANRRIRLVLPIDRHTASGLAAREAIGPAALTGGADSLLAGRINETALAGVPTDTPFEQRKMAPSEQWRQFGSVANAA